MLNIRRQWHGFKLPELSAEDQEIVNTLRSDGAYITNLKELNIPDTAKMLAEADKLQNEISNQNSGTDTKSYLVPVLPKTINGCPDLLIWGLHERLLAIVENYLSLPVYYQGPLVRRDISDGVQSGTRHWHLDFEDNRMVKVIVYLSDVKQKNGPFEYIEKKHGPVASLPEYKNGRVMDAEMDKYVSTDCKVSCTGNRGTVLIADTATLWHRGATPEPGAGDRKATFFTYMSTTPRAPEHSGQMFGGVHLLGGNRLSIRQINALNLQ